MQVRRDWLTAAEAAQLTGRSKRTIDTMIHRRRILAQRSGTIWLLYLPALQDYLEYADKVRDAGNPTAAKELGGPFIFLGHGRKVRWSKHMRRWDDHWWEDEELLKSLEVQCEDTP